MISVQEKPGTTAAGNSQVVSALNKQIANWNVLYVKLHNYHWFVKGQQFFTLHQKFEELYTEAATHIDELAERVLSVGGHPLATMREYAAEASVKEASGSEQAVEMAAAVVSDFKLMMDELRTAMETAQKAGDEGTFDMLLGIRSSLEKHVWMLSSFTA
ncbi:Dps family protein [Paenibacillus thermotolerans]|uniref:Dps family protein n=1 Tax=Paenibacillus thermotolerans TaxID=3027807 RepID=UPI002367D2D7|nr:MULTISPECIES: Dps family protein [unclassified Paenibacillus]